MAYVDIDRLKRIAEKARCIIDVVAMPGTYIVTGDPLVRAYPPHVESDFKKMSGRPSRSAPHARRFTTFALHYSNLSKLPCAALPPGATTRTQP